MLSFCFSSHLCSIPCRSARVTEAYIVVAHLARSTYPGTAAFTESQQFGQADKVTKMQLVRERHGCIQGSFINLQQDIDRRTRKESILLSNSKGFLSTLFVLKFYKDGQVISSDSSMANFGPNEYMKTFHKPWCDQFYQHTGRHKQ